MIAILCSFLLFQFGLAIPVEDGPIFSRQWPSCPPPPGGSMMCFTLARGGWYYCNMINDVKSGSPSYFNDWDIALSSVVQGPASITINSDITIPNRWDIMPADFCYGVGTYVSGINANIGVDIDEPWKVWNNGTTYQVPPGAYGVLVINPLTATISGTAASVADPNCEPEGCPWQAPFILNSWQVALRQADVSKGPGTFVDGPINLLLYFKTPIPCLVGSCSHP
jgi:hypothetical protein